jgi:hypothetical protein
MLIVSMIVVVGATGWFHCVRSHGTGAVPCMHVFATLLLAALPQKERGHLVAFMMSAGLVGEQGFVSRCKAVDQLPWTLVSCWVTALMVPRVGGACWCSLGPVICCHLLRELIVCVSMAQ